MTYIYQLINDIVLFSTLVFMESCHGMDEAKHLSWEKGMHGISIFPFYLVLWRFQRSLSFPLLLSVNCQKKK